MNAYARGCAAAQVDNLRDEYGPARARFKVGDRVRVVRLGHEVEGSYHNAKIGEVFTVTDVFDDGVNTNVWHFFPYEIEPVAAAQPAPLQIQAGKYYRTRDGRKVGPMRPDDSFDVPAFIEAWNDGRGWSTTGEALTAITESDLIAEWVDEPKSTKEILDDLEDWMAEQDASRDTNSPSATAGFTVPLEAYELTDEGRQVAESYKQGYEDGYQRGLDEKDSRLSVSIEADTSSLDAEIDRVLERLKMLRKKARKAGVVINIGELQDAA